jgi:DNA-binding IclR family transcriptional regulator
MPSLVPAVDRAIQVLYIFKEGAKKEYGVSEISRLLGLNKSTVHNILNTLAHHNFLKQNDLTRRYQLGPALAELGSLVRSQVDVREVIRPYLRRLMEGANATILLGTFDGAKITIVDKEEPVADVRVSASIGMQIPFCAGAFGQVFLAYLPDETVDQLLCDPGLTAFTPTSITDPDAYRAALARVRAQGYALDEREEYVPGVEAISVPIFIPSALPSKNDNAGPQKEVVAAITLVSFNSLLSPEKIKEIRPLMVQASCEISEKLGVPMA